jgi:hypothetical protein
MKIAAIAALAIILAASGLAAQAQPMLAELVGVWAPDGVSCDLPDDDVDGEFHCGTDREVCARLLPSAAPAGQSAKETGSPIA